MAQKVITSEQFSLNLRDWIKTLLLAVGTPMVFEIQKVIQNAIDTGNFDVHINWKQVLMIGISSGLMYLGKQFFASPKVTTIYKSNEKAVEVAAEIKKDATKN